MLTEIHLDSKPSWEDMLATLDHSSPSLIPVYYSSSQPGLEYYSVQECPTSYDDNRSD
ncbi:hypothetical protein DAPPUDRAFT_239053 [Daphnia pulex]|uniref:Uncharacterized protein n=1 Tax=Daphnia pulex TaxID=6669 RepID=E9G875_DAPPU|nr:hypothetical protein DAPPUDRAFT_239053 [Daphnia pulex]|eukprot:EFX83929.1 hypothetical protein DAPPUDRAFT_239053 [Daphnia pulex]